MALVAQESRIRVGIEWYDTVTEAVRRARSLVQEYTPSELAAANAGYIQTGRAAYLDREVDGPDGFKQRQYAVVVP